MLTLLLLCLCLCWLQVWDIRMKKSVHTMEDRYQVTAVAFSDAGDQVYSAGIDNSIKVGRAMSRCMWG